MAGITLDYLAEYTACTGNLKLEGYANTVPSIPPKANDAYSPFPPHSFLIPPLPIFSIPPLPSISPIPSPPLEVGTP